MEISGLNSNSKIAVYSRRSREDETEDTLINHRNRLQEFVNELEFKNVDWYEEVVTGSSIDVRHEFNKLLVRINNFEYKAILVVDFDRLTRGDTYERGVIERAFKSTQTLILTLSGEVIDYTNEADALSANVKGLIANYELSQITKRMLNGKKDVVKKGRPHSGIVPYGYTWNRNTREADLNEVEARGYRLMVDWYINEQWSFGTIAKKLNEMKILTSKDGRWYAERISNTLQNEFHLGYVHFGMYKTEKTGRFNDKGKMINRIVKNENIATITREIGNHTPLKTPEEHAKIMKRVIENRKYGHANKINDDNHFKLKSLVRCPYCKLATGIIFRSDRAVQIRKCTKPSKHRRTECDSTVGMIEADLYKAVIELLKQHRDEFFIHIDEDDTVVQSSALELEISSIEKSIVDNEKRIEKEKEMFRAGIINIEDLKNIVAKITEDNKSLEERLLQLKQNQSYLEKADIESKKVLWNSDKVANLLENPSNGYYTDKEINDILKSIILYITYTRLGDDLDITVVYK